MQLRRVGQPSDRVVSTVVVHKRAFISRYRSFLPFYHFHSPRRHDQDGICADVSFRKKVLMMCGARAQTSAGIRYSLFEQQIEYMRPNREFHLDGDEHTPSTIPRPQRRHVPAHWQPHSALNDYMLCACATVRQAISIFLPITSNNNKMVASGSRLHVYM